MAAQEPSKLLVRVRSSSPAPPSTSPRLALRRGVAQSGSASGWGPEGRWFESRRPDFLRDPFRRGRRTSAGSGTTGVIARGTSTEYHSAEGGAPGECHGNEQRHTNG